MVSAAARRAGHCRLRRAFGLWRSWSAPSRIRPPDETYRVYTRDFDKVLSASEIAVALPTASPDVRKGFYQKAHAEWPSRIAAAERLRNDHSGDPRCPN